METSARPFRDLRVVKSERTREPQSTRPRGRIFRFDVIVLGSDGVRRRIGLLDVNRFCAARQAETTFSIRHRCQAVVELVCVDRDESQPEVLDESQGPTDFVVSVTDRRGLRRVVCVRAVRRAAAIAAAENAVWGGRTVAVRSLFRGRGRCRNCDVPLFADMKLRASGDGWKCLDCA